MPKFYVRESFAIPERRLFVIAGAIVEGDIRAGMFVRVPLNNSMGLRLLIDSIELTQRNGGGEDVCLCIGAGQKFSEILKGLSIGEKTVEVTSEGAD